MPIDGVLTVLVPAVGSGIVEAMTSKAWEGVSARVARLFGRGDPARTARAAQLLEASRERVLAAPPRELPAIAEVEAAGWRGTLRALVAEDPGVEAELAELAVAFKAARGTGGATAVDQYVNASGNAVVFQAGRDIKGVNAPDAQAPDQRGGA